jgi:hypothetical protein
MNTDPLHRPAPMATDPHPTHREIVFLGRTSFDWLLERLGGSVFIGGRGGADLCSSVFSESAPQ